MTVLQIFEDQIRPLPEADRLQMATLILNSVAPQMSPGYSDDWSAEDRRALTASTLRHAMASYPEDGEIV